MKIDLNRALKNGDEFLYEEFVEVEANKIKKEAFDKLDEYIKENPVDEIKKQIILTDILTTIIEERRKPMTLGYVIEQALIVPTEDKQTALKRFKIHLEAQMSKNGIIDLPTEDISMIKEAIAERWVQITEENGKRVAKVLPLIYAQACGLIEAGVL